MADPIKEAYANKNGKQKPGIKDEMQQGYMKYLNTPTDMSTLPTEENIVDQTVQGVKDAKSTVPAILKGLTGVVKYANTPTGLGLLSQAAGGDRFSKQAWLDTAEKKRQEQMMAKQAMAQEEQARMGRIGEYLGKQMDIEAQEPYRNIDAQLKGLQMSELQRKPQVEAQAQDQQKIQDLYQANKHLPGAELILSAPTFEEASKLAISKGFKLPLVGAVGGGVKKQPEVQTADPILDKYGVK